LGKRHLIWSRSAIWHRLRHGGSAAGGCAGAGGNTPGAAGACPAHASLGGSITSSGFAPAWRHARRESLGLPVADLLAALRKSQWNRSR
jgi:hypothetical protein